MKFVHIADVHLDMPFTTLSNRTGIGELRRIEQREALKKVIEYIKNHHIPYLFIAGDLYEQEYIRESTIQYINTLFKQIPDTKIFITPGNHDPYLKNSFYSQYNWNENVHIFSEEIERIELPECDIYGYGFEDFYLKNNKIQELKIENKNKVNIFITHASLEGGYDDNREYNPISKRELKMLGMDYIALGHIHKLYYNEEENQNIVYPGSTISLGFDELGAHGMIVGEIEKGKIKLEFIPIDTKEFIEKEMDITNCNDVEELIEKINILELEENKYYKINLIGKRKFEINMYQILKNVTNKNIIKIKNNTTIYYNIENIAEEINLKGLFIKEIKNKMQEGKIEKEKLEKALEIGLEIFDKK